jgi:hypothetical protein
VINAPATARNRPLLEAINAGRDIRGLLPAPGHSGRRAGARRRIRRRATSTCTTTRTSRWSALPGGAARPPAPGLVRAIQTAIRNGDIKMPRRMSGLPRGRLRVPADRQSEAVVDRILQAAGYYIHRGPSGGTPQVGARAGSGSASACGSPAGAAGRQGEQRLVLPFDPEGGGTAQTGFFGFGLFVPSSHAAAYGWIGLFDAVNDVPHVTMRIGANGVLQAYRGYPSGGDAAGHLGGRRAHLGQLGPDRARRRRSTIPPATFEIRVNSKPVDLPDRLATPRTPRSRPSTASASAARPRAGSTRPPSTSTSTTWC